MLYHSLVVAMYISRGDTPTMQDFRNPEIEIWKRHRTQSTANFIPSVASNLAVLREAQYPPAIRLSVSA